MNNNRPKKPKSKQIKKQAQKPSKPQYKKSKEDFSFQEAMVDLISDSQGPDSMQAQQNIEIKTKQVEQEIESQHKQVKLSNGHLLVAVDLEKHYNVFISHEQSGKVSIQTVFDKDRLTINGKACQTFAAYHNFVFTLRTVDKTKQTLHSIASGLHQTDKKTLKQFLKGVNMTKESLIQTTAPLRFTECPAPWLGLPKCIQNNDVMMLLGLKNTGKSTLGQFLLNSKGEDLALLDCDIGRNSCLEACISLSTSSSSLKIWIGQLTPLNNLQTYLRGIRYLFSYFREHMFTKKLIVNTMGYTTGLGQYLIYQIYQIVQPRDVLVLQSKGNSSQYDSVRNIVNCIKNKTYTQRLHLSRGQQQILPVSSTFHYYNNPHASSKKQASYRFQKHFEIHSGIKINNICDLLEIIQESNSPYLGIGKKKLYRRTRNEVEIYEQSRHGKEEAEGKETVKYRALVLGENVNMRLIVLGTMVQQDTVSDFSQNYNTGLFQVKTLGFCFQDCVYAPEDISGLVGVVNQGIDFEKRFYHLNQKQLIELQLKMGRIPYLMVGTKGIGSKGVRNNPSKTN